MIKVEFRNTLIFGGKIVLHIINVSIKSRLIAVKSNSECNISKWIVFSLSKTLIIIQKEHTSVSIWAS